jgi:SAM-dependent methyltransferase
MTGFPDCPLTSAADGPLIARLRDAFDCAGYTEALVAERQQQALTATGDTSPLTTLVSLFLLGKAVSPDAARAAIGPLSPADCVRRGFLSEGPDGVRASVQIAPFRDLRIAADWPDPPEMGIEPVMGVAASTLALAQMMIPRHVERALDLGAGSGVLALLAAGHADRVWAVDLNPRAIALTRFNAVLNGITNIETRAGNLFDPVAGETFDLIACNPPFVIGPTAGRMHSQTGLPGDDFCRSIVRAAPRHLRPGGFCQIVLNWIQPAGGDWRQRLAGWFDGLDCDAWVLHSHTEDAATYARHRISERTHDADEAGRMFDRWTTYFERSGIAAIGFGVMTLRRTAGRACWFRCDQLPPLDGSCGADIAAWFARRDFLDARPDEASLLAARVRRADELSRDESAGLIRRARGMMFAGAADASVAAFVRRCTGARRLGEELSHVAAELGRDPKAFTPAFLTLTRRLIEVGILEPAEQDSKGAGP